MSPHVPTTNPPPRKPRPQKRAKLPEKATISKRPLHHPPLPTPSSAAQQTIYIRPRTPFIPTLKRITRLLAHIEARHAQATKPRGELTPATVEKATAEAVRRARAGGDREGVVLKASGRAIERALGVAGYLVGRGGVRVRVRTGTVGVVDDVDVPEGEDEEMGDAEEGEEQRGEEEEGEQDKEEEEDEEEVPEARVRQISFVEVWVSAR